MLETDVVPARGSTRGAATRRAFVVTVPFPAREGFTSRVYMKSEKQANPEGNLSVVDIPEKKRDRRDDSRSADKTIPHGEVRTCIWANRTQWGDIEWRIEQFREYVGRHGRGYSRSLRVRQSDGHVASALAARAGSRSKKGGCTEDAPGSRSSGSSYA